MSRLIDLKGNVYGGLTVLERGPGERPNLGPAWTCRCFCGGLCTVRGMHLRSGATTSCGCVMRASRVARFKTLLAKPAGVSAFNALCLAYKHRAKKRGVSWTLSPDQARLLFAGTCVYCGVEPSQVKTTSTPDSTPFVYNGIDRVDNAAGYVLGNVVSCCGICNKAKRDLSVEDFVAWLVRVHARMVEMTEPEDARERSKPAGTYGCD